jgi:hypothetical protein
MCYIRRTSLGSGVVCARCSEDCECTVCLPADQQEQAPTITRAVVSRMSDDRLRALLDDDIYGEDDRETIEDELEARDEYRAGHDDTPSLQDNGNYLGSYGS